MNATYKHYLTLTSDKSNRTMADRLGWLSSKVLIQMIYGGVLLWSEGNFTKALLEKLSAAAIWSISWNDAMAHWKGAPNTFTPQSVHKVSVSHKSVYINDNDAIDVGMAEAAA